MFFCWLTKCALFFTSKANADAGLHFEAKKRAMATAAAMIGAITMSRVLTDQKLSDALLQAVEESITRP
jgi:hypothetical protein